MRPGARQDVYLLITRLLISAVRKRIPVPLLFGVIMILAFYPKPSNASLVPDVNREDLLLSSPRVKHGFVFCFCSPTDGGFPPTSSISMKSSLEKLNKKVGNATDISEAVQTYQVEAFESLGKCVDRSSYESCINADAHLRKKFDRSLCTYDDKTGKNVAFNNPNPNTVLTLGKCDLSVKFKRKTVNEGCVAIEHLKGYNLLHKKNLMRPVLCANGFCATPNHEIIVDGRFTSMHQLCRSGVWRCIEETKLVNNIKVWQTSRVRVSDIVTITPYDVRYPKWMIWVAQLTHEIWNTFSTLIIRSRYENELSLALEREEINCFGLSTALRNEVNYLGNNCPVLL